MIDVIKSLGFEYITVNPGANFRGLIESAVNYGGNKNPQLITALHEETCVAVPHGYAKIEGKPMGVFIYGTVGMQHAAMAVYSAWCDRVPVVIFVGNELDMADSKRPRRHGSQRTRRERLGSQLYQMGRCARLTQWLCRVRHARL